MDYWLNAPIRKVIVHEDIEEFVWSKVTNHILNVEEIMKAVDIYTGIILRDRFKKGLQAINDYLRGLR